jgi:hypothetical protein
VISAQWRMVGSPRRTGETPAPRIIIVFDH